MSDPSPDIQPELVLRAQSGDEAALTALIEGAYPLVRRWALIRTGHLADAEDLTQDVLVQMLRKLDSYGGGARFSTWLYSVTKNAAADRYRRDQRRRRLAEDRGYFEGWVPEPAVDPLESTERGELARTLRAFFEELPERQREVFDLVELQGYSAAAAADLLNIEPVTIRAHLFKARKQLRRNMLERHSDVLEEAR